MAIKVGDPQIVPTLSYENVFMERLQIGHVISAQEDLESPFDLLITYKLYALDGNTRYFEDKSRSIVLKDYLTLAYQKASIGDTDLLYAFAAIQNAVAILIEDQIGKTTEVS
jgi:predicted nucleic acid-binding protein